MEGTWIPYAVSLCNRILSSGRPARSIQKLWLWEEDRHSPEGLQHLLLTFPPLLLCPWQDEARHPAANRDNQVKRLHLSPLQRI